MRRLLAAVLAAVTLVAGTFSPAQAVTDYGNPAVTRLWVGTSEGDRFVCTASYIFPYVNENISWLMTAGHCTLGDLVKRDADTTMVGVVNWRGVILGNPNYTSGYNDIAIGTVPDVRDGVKRRLWLADSMPKRGAVYVHGFPAGVERVTVGYIVPIESKYLPGSVMIAVRAGEIEGGSSGSPVLGPDGRVVGILWGIIVDEQGNPGSVPEVGELREGWMLALVTPIEKLHELMNTMGVKK
jgi:hypothetical protein